jgi:predicted ATP-grasp superfamily ATP-dependent carboligase
VAPSDQLSDRVAELLRSIGFWGMVQLQFLGSDSDPVVIDANPRFFGSMPLAVASGVNLPALWHAAAQEQDVAAQLSYREGVHYRWLEADLVAARRQGLSLLRPVRGPVVGAMWAGDDPVPGLVMAAEQLSVRARRLLRSRAR